MHKETTSLNLSDISPICVARMLLRNLWMIVATAMIFAMGSSLVLSLGYEPVYQASMTYAVTSRLTSFSSANNLSASKEVASVMMELLETNVITDEIRQYSPELADFDGSITAAQVGDTNMLTVTAQASTPELAFRALDALVEIFPELSDYISQSSMAQVIRNPSVSAWPINQVNKTGMAKKCALAGGALMALLLCWMCVRRETIQTREGARHLLDAHILATVPHERKNRTLKAAIQKATKGLQVFAPTTSYLYMEQINQICSRLEQENAANGYRTFLITGVGENEGKSTIAGNVAAMLAMKGKKVALVDGDLRKPAMNRFFDGAYQSKLPLDQMLQQPFSRENLLECMVRHPRLGLYMLFCAKPVGKSMRLLTGDNMKHLLRNMQVFDYVIIDTPPMGFFADAEALADQVDASILVARQDYTPACDLNDAADALRSAKSTFLGCVLNNMTGVRMSGNGYGYGYGYGYTDSKSRKKKS